MNEYEEYLESIKNIINSHLSKYISMNKCKAGNRVLDAMSYSLLAGGKRIRPALCMATAEAIVGKESNGAIISLSCAIEMIHTYSLIHDDLPAMDNDTLRRGKLTCHKQFDDATAILAGDALLTLAFEILSSAALNDSFYSPKLFAKIVHKISVSAGFRGMVGGQMRDIASEGLILSIDQLENIHLLKTGMIIELAIVCSAMLVRATKKQLVCLKKFARNLGLAFQVKDDILDVVGDSKYLGKLTDKDSIKSKNTYPSIIGLRASEEFAKKLIDDALGALNYFDEKADPLRNIGRYILERNS